MYSLPSFLLEFGWFIDWTLNSLIGWFVCGFPTTISWQHELSQYWPWGLSHWSLSCSAHDKVDHHTLKHINTFIIIVAVVVFLVVVIVFVILILIFAIINLKAQPHNDFAERWKTQAITEERRLTTCRTPQFQTSVLGSRRWISQTFLLNFSQTRPANLNLENCNSSSKLAVTDFS